MGSEDTAVYIVDVTTRGFGGLPLGGPAYDSGSAGGRSSAASNKPVTVTALKVDWAREGLEMKDEATGRRDRENAE